MFQSKRKKIAGYLVRKTEQSAFDRLLRDYLERELGQKLAEAGVTKSKIHIDWLPNYQSIDIQGRHGTKYVDIQVEDTAFSIACDEDEPDDPVEYPLISAKSFYRTVEQFLNQQ